MLLSESEIRQIFSRWQAQNPEPASELEYKNPFTLLVAVVLSAQATDKSVNLATKDLFKVADTPQKMLALGEEGLIPYIKSIGLYKSKAAHVIGLSRKLIEDFDGLVPDSREKLMTLPGVGRKTANVVLNVIFHQPVMPVDTHLLRVSPKIGLAEGKTPEEVEASLVERIPPEYMHNAHHWILLHGRYVCTARNPNCGSCIISDLCKKNGMENDNFFTPFTWEKMLSLNPPGKYDIAAYHKILSPDFPEFLKKYIELPLLQRLKGIGLLCGTDWTPLYKNRFYYSRLDHSIGVALIIWHFTQDKAQTIAGLLHDVSTPVFSHVSDFRKGDALTQTAIEAPNEKMIRNDKALLALLKEDGLTVDAVVDYHKYPVADNEIPQLSADRLEYMYPSGMALDGSWTMEEIERTYNDISVLKNEDDEDELGFNTLAIAEEYCRHFCMIGHILQLNENKLALHFLGQIMNKAVTLGILQEKDFMTLSEREVMEKLEKGLESADGAEAALLHRYYKTFRTMKSIEHTEKKLPDNEYFCISLKVKQRFINPLVKDVKKAVRLSELSSSSHKIIEDFKTYTDTLYGCVKLV